VITADRVLLVAGAAVVVLGLSSRLVKRHALSPFVLALVAGAAVGPAATGVLDPLAEVPRGPLLEQLCRVALALSVLDITLRTRPSDLRANARRLAVMLGLLMPVMWLVSALGAGLLLGLPLAVALLLGAALTPTDPGVAGGLVSGVLPNRSLPRRIRMSLQVEAAANDGLALPFVLLSGLLVTLPAGEAVGDWVPEVLRELGVAVVVGGLLGLGVRRLTDLAGVDRLAEEDWFPLAGAGVALTVLAATHLLGGTGVFAAFVAGLVFSEGLPEPLREPIHEVHRSVTKLALAVVFLTFGTVLPVDGWRDLGWPGAAFALWVLVLRRLPAAYPLLRATRTGPLSAAYLGWSGPLGVAAIYYLVVAERYGVPDYDRLFAAGTLAVALSVLGQAASASPAVHRYRRRTGRVAAEGEELEVQGRLP
jgi:sodium/hydrogen antiporter